jgi:hypothetical protein
MSNKIEIVSPEIWAQCTQLVPATLNSIARPSTDYADQEQAVQLLYQAAELPMPTDVIYVPNPRAAFVMLDDLLQQGIIQEPIDDEFMAATTAEVHARAVERVAQLKTQCPAKFWVEHTEEGELARYEELWVAEEISKRKQEFKHKLTSKTFRYGQTPEYLGSSADYLDPTTKALGTTLWNRLRALSYEGMYSYTNNLSQALVTDLSMRMDGDSASRLVYMVEFWDSLRNLVWVQSGALCGVPYDPTELASYTQIIQNLKVIIPFPNICIVSAEPTECHWDPKHKGQLLLSKSTPALVWPDGYSITIPTPINT